MKTELGFNLAALLDTILDTPDSAEVTLDGICNLLSCKDHMRKGDCQKCSILNGENLETALYQINQGLKLLRDEEFEENEENEEIAYLLHKEGGEILWYNTLKQARVAYKEQLSCGESAMITRQSINRIQLNSFDHIQGHL